MKKGWKRKRLLVKYYLFHALWVRRFRYRIARLFYPCLPRPPICKQCGEQATPWAYLDSPGWILGRECGCMNWTGDPDIPWPFRAQRVAGSAWERVGFDVGY